MDAGPGIGNMVQMSVSEDTLTAWHRGPVASRSDKRQEAEKASRWSAGLDPDNPIYSHSAALSAVRAGDGESAERLFLRALSGTRDRLGQDHPFMLLVARDWAAFRESRGDAAAGARLAQQILPLANPLAVARAGDKTLDALTDLCRFAGCLHVAVPFFNAALACRYDEYGADHKKTAVCIAKFAEIYRKLGDENSAYELCRRSGPAWTSALDGHIAA